jgi:hypothetical protein
MVMEQLSIWPYTSEVSVGALCAIPLFAAESNNSKFTEPSTIKMAIQ